jgi:hypothetical protein
METIYQLTRRYIPEDLNLNKQTARETFALSLHFRMCDKISYNMLKPSPVAKESVFVQLNFRSIMIQYL